MILNLIDNENSKTGKGFHTSLFGLLDGNINKDKKIFEKLVIDVKEYGRESKQVKNQINQLSKAHRSLATNIIATNNDNSDASAAFLEQSKSIEKATISTKAFAAAQKVAAIATNMLVMAFASWAIGKIVKYLSDLKTKEELVVEAIAKQTEKVEKLKTKVNELTSAYDALDSKTNRTESENIKLSILKEELDTQKQLYEIEQKRLFDEKYGKRTVQNTNDGSFLTDFLGYTDPNASSTKIIDPLNEVNGLITIYKNNLENIKTAQSTEEWDAYNHSILVQKDSLIQTYKELKTFKDVLGSLPEEYESILLVLEELLLEHNNISEGLNQSDILLSIEQINGKIDELQSRYQTLTSVMQDYNSTGIMTIDNMQALINLGNDYLQYLSFENGAIKINTEGLKKLALARIDDAEASYLQESIDLIAKLNNESSASEYLKNTKGKEAESRLKNAEAIYQEAIANAFAENKTGIINDALTLLNTTVESTRKVFDEARNSVGSYTNTTMGTKDAIEKTTSASDKLNNSLREEGNARIKVLDKEIQRIKDRQKVSDEYYDKKIKRLQDEKEELQDEWKEQDALLQIEKDRKALEDTKNQKTVNLYKKGEGFTYNVDQEAVDTAQETLDKSQQDYDRQQELQAIDDKVSRLERLKKKSHESYDSQIEDLEEIKEKYQEAMSHIGETMDEHKAHIEINAEFERETLNQQAKSWEDYADRVVESIRRIERAKKKKSSSGSSKGGRAIGSRGIESSGVYNVHEEGSEIIVRQPSRGSYTFLEYGDGVLPRFETKNLMEIGALGINGLADRMSKMFSPVARTSQSSPSIQITIPSIHLHEVQNVETLGNAIVNQLPNTVIQKLFKK